MGKSNVQVYGLDKKIKVRFKHVAGNTQAKAEVMEFVDFLKKPEKYTRLGAKTPRGALIVGPPGTGKTMLAKAVASQTNATFIRMVGSEFVQKYLGEGPRKVIDVFRIDQDITRHPTHVNCIVHPIDTS
jgi:AFG3 family protein